VPVQERYLMEKLAEMSHVLSQGAAAVPKQSLASLARIKTNDKALQGTLGALSGYARRAQIVLSPEIGRRAAA
jgi:hypothetical protein